MVGNHRSGRFHTDEARLSDLGLPLAARREAGRDLLYRGSPVTACRRRKQTTVALVSGLVTDRRRSVGR
jgi:hypothetical protein